MCRLKTGLTLMVISIWLADKRLPTCFTAWKPQQLQSKEERILQNAAWTQESQKRRHCPSTPACTGISKWSYWWKSNLLIPFIVGIFIKSASDVEARFAVQVFLLYFLCISFSKILMWILSFTTVKIAYWRPFNIWLEFMGINMS